MNSTWTTRPLGDVAEIGAGNSAPQSDLLFANGTHPFFRTADAGRIRFGEIHDSVDHLNVEGIKGLRRHPKGTILFPKSGASTFLNHRVMLGVDGYVSSHLATIRAREHLVSSRFLLYYLSTIAAQDLVQDHAYPSLNLSAIAGIPVAFPSLPEQAKIVSKLDDAYLALSRAKATAEQNLRNAEALFDEHLAIIFSNQATGWVGTTIGDAVHFIDYRGKTPDKTTSGLRLITAKNVKMGYLQATPMEYVAPQSYESWMTRGIPRRGDVLFTTEAPLANVAQLDTDDRVVFAQRIIIMQPDRAKLDSTFLKYMLLSRPLQERIRTKGTGATVQGIKASLLKTIAIAFPKSLAEQRRITGTLDTIRNETRRLAGVYARKSELLDGLKLTLLHQSFTSHL